MIREQVMRVDYKENGYFRTKRFIQVSHDNDPNKIYLIGNDLSTKDEGNSIYLEIVNSYKSSINKMVDIYEYEDNEYLKKLDDSIDHYVQYIDDYKQMKQAEERNRKIRNIIDKVCSMFNI